MSRNFLALLLFGGLAAACPGGAAWSPFPIWGGGYIMNVLVAPSAPDVWYACVDVGGPYRSDDAGKTWRPLHLESRLKDCGPYASMARSLSVDPRDSDSFVAATGNDPEKGGSLVVSRDGGRTFRRTGRGCFRSNGPRRMHGIALDRNPFNPDELIAGEYLDGFHLSTDGGESWRDFGPNGFWFSDVRYDRSRPGTVYACAPEHEGNGGFFRSQDGGRTWIRLSDETPTEVCQIAGRGDLIGLFHDRVKVSADCGETWRDYSDGLILENLVTDGDPNPSKSTGVYVAACAGSNFYLVGNRRGDIFIRRPGDVAWRKTPRMSQNPGDPPAEHSILWSCKCKKMDALCSIVVLPDDDGHWLACDWHVIWESTDAGKNWTTRVKGIAPLCPFIVAGSPAKKDVILYGVADMGLYVSTDNGRSFRPVRETSGVNSISFSSRRPLTGYAVGGKFTTDLIRTDDGGATWRKLEGSTGLPPLKPKELAAFSVAVDPLTDDVFIAVSGPCGKGRGGIYRSSDGGASWRWAGDGLPEGKDLFKSYEFDKGHADAQLVISPDGSFLACSQKTGVVACFNRKTETWETLDCHVWGTRIFADPHVPGRFIHAEREAKESLDGGRTWRPCPSIPSGSWYLAFDPRQKGLVVAGADRFYLSRDGGASFAPLPGGLDLPTNGSRAISLDRGRLFALTFGAGVWTRDVAPSDVLTYPPYRQIVEATFATEREAAESSCSVARLPDDADLSFGCRWDDTNPAHLAKAAMMERAGVKGTFYVCADESDLFRTGLSKLTGRGHAVGNHTVGHPHLFSMNPNAAFRAIAANRIAIETNIHHSVTSFVNPYGWEDNPIDPDHRPMLASCIVATGHFVTQDNPMSWRGAPDAVSYMPSWRFSANDAAPSRELFEDGFEKMLASAKGSTLIPRLGFGTHSWCNAAGNALQEELLKEHCAQRNWAQMNDWEYGAYRYEALHGDVRKISSEGVRARFEVKRFPPSLIGGRIALSLKFVNGEPTGVKTSEGKLKKGGRGTWTLPHSEGMRLHDRIASVDANGQCGAFPGLEVTVDPDESCGLLRVRVANRTGRDLRRIIVSGAFPPKWTRRQDRAGMKYLRDGRTFDCALEMGRVERRDWAFGVAYYPVSVDFSDDTGVFRVWCEKSTPRVEVPATLPSQAVRVWGPGDATALKDADWCAASCPDAELPDAANWKTPGGDCDALWCLVAKPEKCDLKWNAHVRERISSPVQGRFFAYDFSMAETQTVHLRTTVEASRRNVALWINGERLEYTGTNQAFTARKGKNRVILRADAKVGDWFTDAVYFAVTGDDGLHNIY